MRSVRNSLAISFGQTYILLLANFVASLFIARLLKPSELGVFSVSLVVISIGQTLRDFGVATYIIQEQELTESRIRAASLVTLIAAWTIAAIVFISSEPISEFYRDPALASLIRILGLNYLLLPFGSVVSAYLRRQLQFGLLAKISLAVGLTQALLSVGMAYLGFRYYAMALAAVAASLLHMALMQFVRPKGFPFMPGLKELRHVLKFGSLSSIASVLQEIGKGLPDLILGRLLGMRAVGLFGRAVGLLDLFNRLIGQTVQQVALPHFSSRLRDGHEIAPAYLHSVAYVTAIGWPVYLFLCLTAGITIPVLYGPQWAQAISLAQILALGEITAVPFSLLSQLLIASGAIKLETYRAMANVLIRFLPLYLLSGWGLEPAAIGYAASTVVISMLSFMMLRSLFSITLGALLLQCRASAGPVLGSGLCTVGGLILAEKLELNLFFSMALLTLLFGTGWLVGLFGSRHPLSKEISTIVDFVCKRRQ